MHPLARHRHLVAGLAALPFSDFGRNHWNGNHFFRRLEIRMSRTLILLGLILVAVGLLWRWIGPLKLGRLPGDIVVEHQNFSFYFPITSGLLISAVLTLILWLIKPHAPTACGRLTAGHARVYPPSLGVLPAGGSAMARRGALA